LLNQFNVEYFKFCFNGPLFVIGQIGVLMLHTYPHAFIRWVARLFDALLEVPGPAGSFKRRQSSESNTGAQQVRATANEYQNKPEQ
jgi:hypothetical protein